MTFEERLNKLMVNERDERCYGWRLSLDDMVLIVSEYFQKLRKWLASPLRALPRPVFRIDLVWLRTRSFCVRDNYHPSLS